MLSEAPARTNAEFRRLGLLVIPEQYANWRCYLFPVTTGLGGFAIGRLSFAVIGGAEADQLFSDPAGARSMILILFIIATFAILAYVLIRGGEATLGYMLLVVLLLPSQQLLTLYRQPTDVVSVDDYILLATTKAKSREFDTSLKHFETAKKITASEQIRRSIDKQIEAVVAEASKPRLP
jgi:hypothetical protein